MLVPGERRLEAYLGDKPKTAGVPTDVAWRHLTREARNYVDRQRRRTCEHAFEFEQACARRDFTDDMPGAPASVYVDDPRRIAFCDECHEERSPFLPGESSDEARHEFFTMCRACGEATDDEAGLQWRIATLYDQRGLHHLDRSGNRGRLRVIEFATLICDTCWPWKAAK